jgi:hypothetical protein
MQSGRQPRDHPQLVAPRAGRRVPLGARVPGRPRGYAATLVRPVIALPYCNLRPSAVPLWRTRLPIDSHVPLSRAQRREQERSRRKRPVRARTVNMQRYTKREREVRARFSPPLRDFDLPTRAECEDAVPLVSRG